MGRFDLIAFDMDGTLLRSDKTVSPAVSRAIGLAASEGKQIALATGRPVAELKPYEGSWKEIRYAILESGGLLYDLWEQKILRSRHLNPSVIPALLDAISQEDIMPQAMSGGASYVSAADLPLMEHYQMGVYRSLYEVCATRVPEIRDYIRVHAGEIEKINLYHVSPDARERTAARLSALPAEKIYAESSSLEISPQGVDKGEGLRGLCEWLDIPPERAVAVGDADNDIPMLRAAGLGIAMGNANERVRSAADAIVADNDHDGCAEAILDWLLR